MGAVKEHENKKNHCGLLIKAMGVTTRNALRWYPVQCIVLIFVTLVCACIPALQVLVLGSVLSSHSAENRLTIASIIILTIVLGGFFPLQAVSDSLRLRLELNLRFKYSEEMALLMGNLTPSMRRNKSIMDGLQTIRDMIDFNISTHITHTITVFSALISTLFLAYSVSTQSSIYTALLCVLSLVPQILAYRRITASEDAAWDNISSVARRGDYLETLLRYDDSGNELYTLRASHFIVKLCRESIRAVADMWDRLSIIRAKTNALSAFVTMLLFMAALISHVLTGSSSESVTAVAFGLVTGLMSVRSSGNAIGTLLLSSKAVLRYDAIHEHVEEHTALRRNEILSSASSHTDEDLFLHCPRFCYESNKVLDDVHLTFQRGTMNAIVGENGAGKTTLIKLLNGELSSDDVQVSEPFAYNCATMEQKITPFELTIREFISLGNNSISEEEVKDLFTKVGLGFLFTQKSGIDTQLGEQWGGINLSGGQWQRLALARTLLTDRGIIILDEPTSAIDSKSEPLLFELIRSYIPEKTIIVITHSLYNIKYFDRVIGIKKGEKVYDNNLTESASIEKIQSEVDNVVFQ